MNLNFFKKTIKEAICESFNDTPNDDLIGSLLHDKNNEIVWRCFRSRDENSIFANGYISEYFDDGEGSLYGKGVYSFYKPYGAEKRCGTGGVGNKIMKCVILGGFKDFIILDSKLAKKYYGSDNLLVQLRKFFGNKANEIYNFCLEIKKKEGGDVGIMNGRTAPIARRVFGTKQGKYSKEVLASNIRGIVYNGGNDPNANVLFNPRDIIPIAVTNETKVNGNDFTNWHYKLTRSNYESIITTPDSYIYGERLKAKGLIKDYSKNQPFNNCLNVILNNGRYSLYDVLKDNFISEYGFDECFGWENVTVNGKNILLLPVKVGKNIFFLKENKKDGLYYFYYQENDFQPVMTMEEHDRGYKPNNMINESSNNGFYVYHMTTGEPCKNIFEYGFNAEFSNNEYYGHGVYNALTPKDAVNYLKHFGNYMIKSKLDSGFNNFFITIESIAKKVYGNDYPLIKQLKRLILPEYYDELVSKYGLSRLCSNKILKLLDPNCNGGGDLGKTKIRGLVCPYHNTIPVAICRDWNGIIPCEYSTDNGATWKTFGNNDKLKDFIKQHSNAKIYIEKLIAQGIIKDTFNGNKQSISVNQQFVNGYVQVILSKNNKVSFYSQEDDRLISTEGFDSGVAAEVMNIDGDNFIVIPVIDKGEKYFIYKESDGRYQLYKEENVYKKLLGDDGTHINTYIYDNIFLK